MRYPRTHHLPWSEGVNSDDRVISSMDRFVGQRVIVTEKMDGENTSLYTDGLHARSVDGRNHPSRAWVKALHAQFCGGIPQGWRVCGENLYARHSIAYENLQTYFMGFSIWTERNVCLSWDDTVEWFELLGITGVPVLYDGIRTFQNGLRELMVKRFLAKRFGSLYWVNHALFFRGNRVALIKEYRRLSAGPHQSAE